MKGLIGKKIGMTNVFDAYAKNVAVSVIEVDPCVVTQIKTVENDGYEAVQVASFDAKEKALNSAQLGHFKKAGVTPKRNVLEFESNSELSVGDVVKVEDVFKEDDIVSVSGVTKGRGFSGVMKRHGFGGVGDATHGQHNRQRSPGSIGMASDPARVLPGMKMAGQYGNTKQTTRGLRVVKVMPEANLILVKGAVPGPKGSMVTIHKGK